MESWSVRQLEEWLQELLKQKKETIMQDRYVLKYTYGTSRASDSYGYNMVGLKVDDKRVARTCGGGYDMKGTVLGDWIEVEFKDKLLKFDKTFYGLTYVNPDWKPSKETLEQEKKDGFIGLARYQDFHSRTSDLPTKKHTIPMIDGACGESSVTRIIEHLGYEYNSISWKDGIYTVEKAN